MEKRVILLIAPVFFNYYKEMIKELELMLEKAVIIKDVKTDKVSIGVNVKGHNAYIHIYL